MLPLVLALSLGVQAPSTNRLSADEGVLLLLGSTDVDERGRALSALESTPVLLEDERIRRALIQLLATETQNDLRIASRERQVPRRSSARREQLSILVKVVGENGWTEAAADLAKADVYNVSGALYSHGAALFGELVAIVRAVPPPGVSTNYRARRLSILRSLLTRRLLTPQQEQELTTVLTATLEERRDLELLGEALLTAAAFGADNPVTRKRAATIDEIVQRGDPQLNATLQRFKIVR